MEESKAAFTFEDNSYLKRRMNYPPKKIKTTPGRYPQDVNGKNGKTFQLLSLV
jgi:hypothetical protein